MKTGMMMKDKGMKGVARKEMAEGKPMPMKKSAKGYASGGRLSPLADVSSKNPLAYGAK